MTPAPTRPAKECDMMLSENKSSQRSDEGLQKNTIGELEPHNVPITLVEYDPGWPGNHGMGEQLIFSIRYIMVICN